MFALLLLATATATATTVAELEARVALLEAHEHEQEHGHGHGGGAWEWSGIYELGSGSYTWKFHKNAKGVYGAPDESMRVVVLRAGSQSSRDAILDDMHGAAEAVFDGAACSQVHAGGELYPADQCFELWFDSTLNATQFTLEVLSAGRFAVYAAHVPSEFGALQLGTPAGLLAGPLATLTHEALHETSDHEHEQDEMVTAALVIAVIGTCVAMCALAAAFAVWCCHSHRARPVLISRQTRAGEIPLGLSAVTPASKA